MENQIVIYQTDNGQTAIDVRLENETVWRKHRMELQQIYQGKSEQIAKEERRRICSYLMDEISEIAYALPPHTVVPYRNIPKKDYPCSLPREVYTDEETCH